MFATAAQLRSAVIITVMNHPYMDLRSDWAFKHILQNKDILKMLLNDFLPEQIEYVELQPNEIDKLRPDDKNVIMDVLCQTSDGRKFIVEMQRKKKRSFKKGTIRKPPLSLFLRTPPSQKNLHNRTGPNTKLVFYSAEFA